VDRRSWFVVRVKRRSDTGAGELHAIKHGIWGHDDASGTTDGCQGLTEPGRPARVRDLIQAEAFWVRGVSPMYPVWSVTHLPGCSRAACYV
jgi:hypothetical protein